LAVGPDHAVEEGEDDEEKGKDIGDYGEGRCEGTNPLAPISKLAPLIPKSSSGSSELGSYLPRHADEEIILAIETAPEVPALDKRIAF
jgi:hypothetical protein